MSIDSSSRRADVGFLQTQTFERPRRNDLSCETRNSARPVENQRRLSNATNTAYTMHDSEVRIICFFWERMRWKFALKRRSQTNKEGGSRWRRKKRKRVPLCFLCRIMVNRKHKRGSQGMDILGRNNPLNGQLKLGLTARVRFTRYKLLQKRSNVFVFLTETVLSREVTSLFGTLISFSIDDCTEFIHWSREADLTTSLEFTIKTPQLSFLRRSNNIMSNASLLGTS